MAPLSNFYIDTILGIDSNSTRKSPNYEPQDLRVRNYEPQDLRLRNYEPQDLRVRNYEPQDRSNTSTCSSPRSSAEESSSGSGSDNEEINFSFESFYVKTLALHQIKLAQLQLRPPAWSQKQQFRNNNSVEKKSRKYTDDQISILVQRYEASKYVPREDMAKLSAKTGLSMLQVKIKIMIFIFQKLIFVSKFYGKV